MDDDGYPSDTSHQQRKLEVAVSEKYEGFMRRDSDIRHLKLLREEHVVFLESGLERLSSGFVSLDSSRPWLCYWILHSLALLGTPVETNVASRCIDFLRRCQDKRGGFGGGPGQMPHLAPTYAAVSALVTIGGPGALNVIDRQALLSFLMRMKDPTNGSFRMHDDGEVDVRGCYTALAVAHLLNLMTPELVEGTMGYICRCQTYEGGLGGEPGVEAHGGYTYCGLAAAMLLGEADKLDLPSLLDWAVFRQPAVEGGFQGRTNKLVDGCYSFWQGGLVGLFDQLLPATRAQIRRRLRATRESSQAPSPSNSAPEPTSEPAPPQAGSHSSPPRAPMAPAANEAHREEAVEPMEGVEPDTNGNSVEPSSSEEGDGGSPAQRARPQRVLVSALSLFPCPTDEEVLGLRSAAIDGEDDMDGVGGRRGEQPQGTLQETPLFNTHALQAYLLMCCQDPQGGMKDKPGKFRDFYHTCYCLSGLTTAQHAWAERLGASPPPEAVVGLHSNLLEATDPLTNVVVNRYDEAVEFFGCLPVPAVGG